MLNSEQVGRNPAAVFELYPVVAVSSAVDAFAICVADVAFVQVVPSAIIRARAGTDVGVAIRIVVNCSSGDVYHGDVYL